MAKYRDRLPQLSKKLFLTDSGLETTLIFHDGMTLPHFASFDLMATPEGRERLTAYFTTHVDIALASNAGFVFESPTWRASRDWGQKLGYSDASLAHVNRASIALMARLRAVYETVRSPMVLSGNIGPRGDGYRPDARMTVDAAENYHAEQIGWFRDSEADMVSAFTMNYVEEALGIVRAAKAAGMPVVIAFTLETDARLPSGQTLKEAIAEVDGSTGAAPAYYMINCAHPTHFDAMLEAAGSWAERIRGVRANASKRSHAELDAATDLDDGNPLELALQYRALIRRFPQLNVLGGCCGTDHRHVEEIAHACAAHGHAKAA